MFCIMYELVYNHTSTGPPFFWREDVVEKITEYCDLI